MALNFTGGSGGGASSAAAKVTPKITNINVALANTEGSHTLEDETKAFIIRTRDRATLQIAFVATESSTKYITIPPNATYTEDSLELTGKTLYFQTDIPNSDVEILEWK
jgi:hypothetical protein